MNTGLLTYLAMLEQQAKSCSNASTISGNTSVMVKGQATVVLYRHQQFGDPT